MLLELYVHFPFCIKKCDYCDFCSHPAGEEEMIRYCKALEQEIFAAGKKWRDARISTVFLGGGTPSLIPPRGMDGVLSAIRSVFSFCDDVEFTSEANPGTLQPRWLECLLKHGMNRLSLGVQASQDRLLKEIGRIHTFAQVRQAVREIRRFGIKNLNVDLMYGLPQQSLRDWQETLEKACEMKPEHISAYSLILEEGTPLYNRVKQGKTDLPDDDLAAEMYLHAKGLLQKNGYEQYEISNYAAPGMRSRHNVGYWQGAYYLGLGVNAHSMMPPEKEDACWIRFANAADTEQYIRMVNETGSACMEREAISRQEAMFETMMLGLRMTDGVEDELFSGRFGTSMEMIWGKTLKSLISDGLMQKTASGYCMTEKGLLLQNEALVRFL